MSLSMRWDEDGGSSHFRVRKLLWVNGKAKFEPKSDATKSNLDHATNILSKKPYLQQVHCLV